MEHHDTQFNAPFLLVQIFSRTTKVRVARSVLGTDGHDVSWAHISSECVSHLHIRLPIRLAMSKHSGNWGAYFSNNLNEFYDLLSRQETEERVRNAGPSHDHKGPSQCSTLQHF
jgi:hypothetical protein